MTHNLPPGTDLPWTRSSMTEALELLLNAAVEGILPALPSESSAEMGMSLRRTPACRWRGSLG